MTPDSPLRLRRGCIAAQRKAVAAHQGRAAVAPAQRFHAVRDALLAGFILAGAYLMSASMRGTVPSFAAWFALVPLLTCIRILSPLKAMLTGGLWGLAIYAFCSIGSDRLFPASPLNLLLLTAAPAIYGAFGALLTRWIGFSPYILGVSWMGVELALTPIRLSFGLIGSRLTDSLFSDWLGHALGFVVVAFAVAYVNAILVCALHHVFRLARRPIRFEQSSRSTCLRHLGTATIWCDHSLRHMRPRAPPLVP
jgi:hypothetical protein